MLANFRNRGLGVGVNIAILRLRNEQHADHESREREDDRIPEPEIDILYVYTYSCCESSGTARAPSRGSNQSIDLDVRDVAILGLGQEDQPDDQAHRGDNNRVPEARIDVAGCGDDGEDGRRQEAAEPAVADMIGQ